MAVLRSETGLNHISKEILVGLCGPAGCGKDTVASFMTGYRPYAFALPIKCGLNAMFGWSMSHWSDRDWKERVIPSIGKSPRQLAQTLGTEWGRVCVSTELWTDLGLQAWQLQRTTISPRMVITDVRFDNEAKAIRAAGGTVWRVDRENILAVAGHVSEIGISPSLITGTVKNYGSIDQLRLVVHGWTQMLARRYSR